MSKIRLFGTSSGYVEIAPAAAASNNTLTAPSTVGEIIAKDAAGAIGVTSIVTTTATITTAKVGAAVTITESGIEASGIGITCANINGTQIGGRRNLFINGAMQIAQRGTSSTSNGFGSLDRWYNNLSGGSATFSQETNSNPSETGGIQKYARYNVSSSSDYTGIRQRIEDVTSVPAGTVIISFYAKGTAPAGGLYIYTNQDFGSGGSSSVDGTAVLITSSLTSSWVRYTAQITVGSVDGKTIGAGSFFQLTISQGSNSSSTAYDLNITGLQLEIGTQATSFEHRSFNEELALCQRYFYRHGDLNGTRNYALMGVGMIGHNGSTDTGKIQISAPVRMRTQPTATVIGTTSFIVTTGEGGEGTSNMVCTSAPALWTAASSDINFWVDFERSSGGSPDQGIACIVYANNNGANIGFDAEL